MTCFLKGTTSRDVGMYAYQILNQNAIEIEIVNEDTSDEGTGIWFVYCKDRIQRRNEVMTVRFSKRERQAQVYRMA
jgi:hypothetical protein